ncbi:MAG: N-6 DNA methylase, partial [Methylomicrobium sp.]|nr:N-6 DNA methylase [Methylomicrobium sp.]
KRIECGAPDYIVTKGQVPLGYIEAKDVGKSLDAEEKKDQMKRYLTSLGNLILTDYLEFRWYVEGEHRRTVRIGQVGPGGKMKVAPQGVVELAELLQLFLSHQTPTVRKPKELAMRMAAIARMVHNLIEATFEKEGKTGGAFHGQLAAFRETLIPDLEPGQFADMYAQTIAYGLFAARVSEPEDKDFSREKAAWTLPKTNPFLRELFNQIAGPGLDERITWAVDDLANLLSRADMAAILEDFGRQIGKSDPVVHFYETFLASYDPKLRESRGVYYTPEPVVSYIVRSIDHILRTRFGRSMGLADTGTLILDPAVGTATFLYFVIQHVRESLIAAGQGGGWSNYIKEHLLNRIFGFELLMAPYAMAHLKLGLLLDETGYDFSGNERLGIYLTNTLEEAVKKSEALFAQFIADEANAAARIKRDEPIMVVLGNPPYSGHSANKGSWIKYLIEDYKKIDGKPLGEKNPKWLQDDYVKFLRFGQWRIDRTGQGILAFITNHGYLDNPTFRGMRQQLSELFTNIYLFNLHGNSKKKEVAPDGSKDENVFDIQQGVSIGIFVKEPAKKGPATVHYADLWGLRSSKYSRLFEQDVSNTAWELLDPKSPNYLFIPQNIDLLEEYEKGWKITEIFPVNVLGFQTHRDRVAIDFEKDNLRERIVNLRETALTDDELRKIYGLKDSRDWQLTSARERLRNDPDWENHFLECSYRPFDDRPCYFSYAVMDRPRRELLDHVAQRENLCLLASRQQAVIGFQHVLVSKKPANDCLVSTTSREANQVFPLYLYTDQTKSLINERYPNLSHDFIADCSKRLGTKFIPEGKGDKKTTLGPEDIFDYAYAIFHSPTYRERYAEFLKGDFPRLPLTSDKSL